MKKDGTDHVWLDMRPVGEKALAEHFPTICARCREEGFDPLREPIPVVPAQHYFMGGVKVDLDGKTNIKRLFAAGETACNGVHGKNRLASNSLLEKSHLGGARGKVHGGLPRGGIGAHAAADLSAYRAYAALKQNYAKMIREEAEKEAYID